MARSGAQHSAAQRAHATHARQTRSARTRTCVVHSRAVLCLESPTHRASCVPAAWRFFIVPDRTWRFFLCVVAAGLSLCCGTSSRFGCLGSVSLPSLGRCLGHVGVSRRTSRRRQEGVRYSSIDKHDAHSGYYFYESFVSGSHFFALLRC